MSNPVSLLIVSHDVVGRRMAGPGVRYWELARALTGQVGVVLAVPGGSSLCPPDQVELWPYEPRQWDSLASAVEQADVILVCGDVLSWFPQLHDLDIPVIVDGYDPHTVETLALFAGSPEQERRHRERERILRMQCQVGDFFICASERQRDWWLGLLEALGRINVHTYGEDPSLRRLIDVVPFGLPSSPPRHSEQVMKGVRTGIGLEDQVVLWGGGLWQWLDSLTAVRAMALVREQRDDVRMVFPGTRHPNPEVLDMRMRSETIQLANDLDLLDKHVFFGEWVPYEQWPNYLLESDVGVSLHFDTLETRLSFRSRILDYLWAGLPMVVTEGDVISEMVARRGLGKVIGCGNPDELATALLKLLDETRSRDYKGFECAQQELTWEKAASVLVEFCKDPRLAPDRVDRGERATPGAAPCDQQIAELDDGMRATVAHQEERIAQPEEQLSSNEQGRFIRVMRRFRSLLPWRADA